MSAGRAKDALEAALKGDANQFYTLILFVSGTTPNSARAITNTQSMCECYLADRHSLTIIDLYLQPEMAKQEQIVAVPTLIRKLPLPTRRLVGDMSDAARLVLSTHRRGVADGATGPHDQS